MREIKTLIWCDMHNARGELEPATTTETVTLSSLRKPRQLDLCEVCEKEMFGELRHQLEEFGLVVRVHDESVSSAASTEEALVCKVPECSSVGRTFANASSFGAHIRQQHGLRIGEYREQYDTDASTVNHRRRGNSGSWVAPDDGKEYRCPECDVVYSVARGNNRPTQALGVHRRMKHGVKAQA